MLATWRPGELSRSLVAHREHPLDRGHVASVSGAHSNRLRDSEPEATQFSGGATCPDAILCGHRGSRALPRRIDDDTDLDSRVDGGGRLGGWPAPAETFHSRDGILFEGTIRLAASNAAVCNVPEDHYSETEYESLKANHGRPCICGGSISRCATGPAASSTS